MLDIATVATAGLVCRTRYKSGATAEIPGDSVQVVGFNPALAWTGNTGVVVDAASKIGYALSGSGLDYVFVEENLNLRQALAEVLAAVLGVLADAGTEQATFKNPAGTATRAVVDTTSTGDRTAVILTPPT